jgi:predicted ferric reductase
MVPNISFKGFKTFQILTQNTKRPFFDFTEKREFATKTDRNSVFFCGDPQILDQLSITVPYMSFHWF